MNKAELIDAVASSTDLSKADATRAVDAVIDTITETLRGGDSVTLVGFGTFEAQTGETIQIKASNAPAFKAGKAFKDAVN